MTDVSNLILAMRLLSTLTEQVTELIRTSQREGRDITNEELDALRQRSQESLDQWLGMDG